MTLLKVIACHLIGDYVLQIDFIANTKGKNWYHLFVHCFTYCIPFYLVFGFNWKLVFVFTTHLVIDALKARYNKINYTTDQVLHYLVGMIYVLM